MIRKALDSKKYILSFVITIAIFATAFALSDYTNKKRVEEVRNIESNIAIDILSLETQFDLFEDVSCDVINDSILSQEINSLARRLSYMEGSRGADDKEVVQLKKRYSLLQIKDYLLMKKIGEKCKQDPVFILYLYSNKGDCKDCVREGYVLTYLREEYPNLRVYAFDYHLDLSAIRSIASIYSIENKLPAIVINDKLYYGFKSKEEIEELLPESIKQPKDKEDDSKKVEDVNDEN